MIPSRQDYVYVNNYCTNYTECEDRKYLSPTLITYIVHQSKPITEVVLCLFANHAT